MKQSSSMENLVVAMFWLLITPACLSQDSQLTARPNPEDAAGFARWLVREGTWGVLATLDDDSGPFGNVMSYADAGTGIPYFYLTTTLDPTGMYAVRDPRSSFTLSEAFLGYCTGGQADPQSPICAKITLRGNLQLLPENSKEAAFAEAALFKKHPRFKGFPKASNKFSVFKLLITDIFLVNKYAQPRNLTLSDYFSRM